MPAALEAMSLCWCRSALTPSAGFLSESKRPGDQRLQMVPHLAPPFSRKAGSIAIVHVGHRYLKAMLVRAILNNKHRPSYSIERVRHVALDEATKLHVRHSRLLWITGRPTLHQRQPSAARESRHRIRRPQAELHIRRSTVDRR